MFFSNKECKTNIIFLVASLNTYSLIINDNGGGLPAGLNVDQINFLGLKLVKSFTTQLNGELKLKRDRGIELIITFPIKKI